MIAVLATLALAAPAGGSPGEYKVPPCQTRACHRRTCRTRACKRRTCRSAKCKARVRAKRARREGRPALASWYGPGLYGNGMACGGVLTTGTMGVAHKSIACGTPVRVCFRGCAAVRVVDRGPYVGPREFDLTAATARVIGMSGVQTIQVTVG